MSAGRRILCAIFLTGLTAELCAQPNAGEQLWAYTTGKLIAGSVAVGQDGTLYLANAGPALLAVTNAGSNKWSFPLFRASNGGYSSPAVDADGTVYVSSGNLYAVNPSGSQKWAYPADSQNGSPALPFGNEIYIHGYHLVYALSLSGGMIWSNRIGGSYVYGSPSIEPGGSIYALSPENGTLTAIAPDSTTKWQTAVGYAQGGEPAIGADGTIYATGSGLYAFSANGSNLWVNATNTFMSSSPAIAKDGTIYVATCGGGTLYAVNPDGSVKWRTILGANDPTNTPIAATPAIDISGTIYYPVLNTLYALSSAGSVQWTFSPSNGANTYTSPAIGSDGTIYVTFGSTLYALYNTNKLADSPWPMFRQNARHTGKVEKPSLQQPKKRADANFEFQLYAQIDQTQTVQTSTDLVTWSPLTNVAVTNVPMDVVDLCASNFPTRFYRTLSQ